MAKVMNVTTVLDVCSASLLEVVLVEVLVSLEQELLDVLCLDVLEVL